MLTIFGIVKKKMNNLNIILIAIWSSVWVVQYFYVCIRIISERSSVTKFIQFFWKIPELQPKNS